MYLVRLQDHTVALTYKHPPAEEPSTQGCISTTSRVPRVYLRLLFSAHYFLHACGSATTSCCSLTSQQKTDMTCEDLLRSRIRLFPLIEIDVHASGAVLFFSSDRLDVDALDG